MNRKWLGLALMSLLVMPQVCALELKDVKNLKVTSKTCTMIITKVKKNKDGSVKTMSGYKRTDKKKTRFEPGVTWSTLDAKSKEVLSGIEKDSMVRIVYGFGIFGNSVIKARPFDKKTEQKEDTLVAEGKDPEEVMDLEAEEEEEGKKKPGTKKGDEEDEDEEMDEEEEENDETVAKSKKKKK